MTPGPSPRQVVIARVGNEEDLFVPVSLIGAHDAKGVVLLTICAPCSNGPTTVRESTQSQDNTKIGRAHV